MLPAAVIFDVDGVLLELTRDEEEIFFTALARYVPTHNLSRDWNSYRIRNDADIVAEILEGHPPARCTEAADHYLVLLEAALKSGAVTTHAIPGAADLLAGLPSAARTGIATANFRGAARLRLEAVNLWPPVAGLAFGADGGGHKYQILARALAELALPPERVVYVGDNLNDVEAGLRNGVHFIGFSLDRARREALAAAGARHTVADHTQTLQIIRQLLAA